MGRSPSVPLPPVRVRVAKPLVPCLHPEGARSLGPVGMLQAVGLQPQGLGAVSTLGWVRGSSERTRPFGRKRVASQDGKVPWQVAACRLFGLSGRPFRGGSPGLCRRSGSCPATSPGQSSWGRWDRASDPGPWLPLLEAEWPREGAFLPPGDSRAPERRVSSGV